jgi:hypothetical protein
MVAVPEMLPGRASLITRIEVVTTAAPPTFENAPQPPQPQVQISPEDTKKWGRILLIFIIIVFVVPTCIGIAGSIIGTLVAVLAPLVALFFS